MAFRVCPAASPDFSGIWQTTSAADFDLEPHSARKDAPPGAGIVEGNEIPYLPAALEQKKRNFDKRTTTDPRLKCWTLGTPRGIYYPEPFQIFQRDRRSDARVPVRPLRAHDPHRTERCIPKSPTTSSGSAIRAASGNGDTLVVDVKDFNDETWLDRAGNFHSPALHVVERWKFLDAQHHRVRGNARRSEGLQSALEHQRDPPSASEKNFQLDRGLLLHAGLRPVLPRAGKAEGTR